MPYGAGASVTARDICSSPGDDEHRGGSRNGGVQGVEMRKERGFVPWVQTLGGETLSSLILGIFHPCRHKLWPIASLHHYLPSR